MIHTNCQFAAVLQDKLTILLCIVEDIDTQAICLNLMLTASQYVFYDFDCIRAYCHCFPGKVSSIPL